MNPNRLFDPDTRYRKSAAQVAPDGGHVAMLECDLCGNLLCKLADPAADATYSVEALIECPVCQAVHKQFPDLYTWITNVVAKTQRDLMFVPVLPPAAADGGADHARGEVPA